MSGTLHGSTSINLSERQVKSTQSLCLGLKLKSGLLQAL